MSHESLGRENAPDPDAANAGESRLSGVALLIVAIGVVLFVQALFVLSYVGALHHPKPHNVAVGVVGASPVPIAVAKQFSLKTTQYTTESAARAAIDQRKIDGAFVAGPEGATLIVAPAASPAGASALSAAFGAAAAALGQKMEIVQVHPLPPGDAGGAVSFLVVMALIIGGYLSSTIAMAFGRRKASRGSCAKRFQPPLSSRWPPWLSPFPWEWPRGPWPPSGKTGCRTGSARTRDARPSCG